MPRDSTMMKRLARRAKIRRFIQQWKKLIVMLMIVGAVVTLGLLFYGPEIVFKQYRDEVYKKYNNDEMIPAGYVKDLYFWGWFAGITMREDVARDCYRLIVDLRYDMPEGGPTYEAIWAPYDPGTPAYDPYAEPPEDGEYSTAYLDGAFDLVPEEAKLGYYVSRALYQYEVLVGNRYKQRGRYIRELYLADWADTPDDDPEHTRQIKRKQLRYRTGG